MIEVLFYEGISVISKLIEWQTRSTASHVAIRRDGVTIQSWHLPFPRGSVYLHEGPLSPFILHTYGTVVEVFTVPRLLEAGGDGIEDRAWNWALQQVGKKYDFRMVMRFLPRWGETKGSRDKYFCSELVSMAFVVGGFPLLKRIKTAYISPGLLRVSPFLDYSYSMKADKSGGIKEWKDHKLASLDCVHDFQEAFHHEEQRAIC